MSGAAPDLPTRLRAGERLIGTVISLPDVSLAELAGGRLDFAWIDLEHAPLSLSDAQAIAIALQGRGCGALVRLPDAHAGQLAPVLDAGVDGVVVPRVETAEQAAAVLARVRYPPAGSRGYGPRRAGDYGCEPPTDRPLVLVQIETAHGVQASEHIATVDGVDALVVGTADLSYELGVPLDLTAPALAGAIARVADAAGRAGIACGIAGGGPPATLASLAPTATVVVYSVEARIYARALEVAVAEMAAAFTLDAARTAGLEQER